MQRWLGFVVLLVTLSGINAVVYLRAPDSFGFPLDDAWIHQTFARNFARSGTFTFLPGAPSTGSTSPVWTLLLSVGPVLSLPATTWAYLLGSLFAVLTALAAAALSMRLFGQRFGAIVVGVLTLIEWHLAWAALSGMEISLFTFASLTFFLAVEKDKSPFVLGLIVGLLILIRPEGVLLAGLYTIHLFAQRSRPPLKRRGDIAKPGQLAAASIVALARKFVFARRRRKIGVFWLPIMLLIAPWVAFNLIYGGRPFPSTIASKFLQFGHPFNALRSLRYLWDVAIYFTLDPLLLVAPFSILAAYRSLKSKNTALRMPLFWLCSLIAAYAIAQPVVLSNGRYLMPLIPLVIVFGVEGIRLAESGLRRARIFWPAYRVALLGMVAVLWLDRAATFGLQVDLIAANHFQIAEWIIENTAARSVIATHDIGTFGYKTEREIVDLAGLITPEAIPLTPDQRALARFASERGAAYAIVYTGYYTEFLQELDAELVYSPDAERLRALGLEPLEVHRIN